MEINRDIIKDHRATRSWSQQHLADACDISLRTIQRVENLGVASSETVMALAAALDIEQASLLPKAQDAIPFFIPKSPKGIFILVLGALMVGAMLGAYLANWLTA
ncbi:helix-turn-helix transcriptional regulator [Paremcibacter congregatus]|nr:helix-turn-helix transcriptional regulator [Paremcibacter congregatus]